jgi:hypothetical protein
MTFEWLFGALFESRQANKVSESECERDVAKEKEEPGILIKRRVEQGR